MSNPNIPTQQTRPTKSLYPELPITTSSANTTLDISLRQPQDLTPTTERNITTRLAIKSKREDEPENPITTISLLNTSTISESDNPVRKNLRLNNSDTESESTDSNIEDADTYRKLPSPISQDHPDRQTFLRNKLSIQLKKLVELESLCDIQKQQESNQQDKEKLILLQIELEKTKQENEATIIKLYEEQQRSEANKQATISVSLGASVALESAQNQIRQLLDRQQASASEREQITEQYNKVLNERDFQYQAQLTQKDIAYETLRNQHTTEQLQASAKFRELNTTIERLNNTNSELRNQTLSHVAKIAELEAELAALKKDITNCSISLDLTQTAGSKLHQELEEKIHEISILKSQITEKNNEIHAIQILEITKDTQIRSKEEELRNAQFQINTLIQQLNDTNLQHSQQLQERESLLQQTAEKLKLTEENLETMSEPIAENLTKANATIQLKDQEIAKLQNSLASLNTRFVELETRMQIAENASKVKHQSLPFQNTLQQNQGQQSQIQFESKTAKDVAITLSEILTREEKKTIPIYKGYSRETTVTSWLKEAEAVADANNWDDQTKKKFFGSRLKDAALTWHRERAKQYPHESYKTWRKEFIQEYRDPADRDSIKYKLNNLVQKPEQRVKAYIAEINTLYNDIYGEDDNEEDEDSFYSSRNRQTRNPEATALRNDKLLSIFLRGLQPKIKAVVFERYNPDGTFDETTKTAIEAEKVVLAKETIENKPTSTVSFSIDTADKIIKQVTSLEQRIEKILKVNDTKSPQDSTSAIVAAVEHNIRGRNTSYDRRSDSPYPARRNSFRNHRSQSRSPHRPQRPNSPYNRSSSFRQNSRSPRRYSHSPQRNTQKFQSNSRSHSRENSRPTSRASSASRSPSRNRTEQTNNRPNFITCPYCNKQGHAMQECYALRRHKQRMKRMEDHKN